MATKPQPVEKTCRQCHEDYTPPYTKDDGFCSDDCKKLHDGQLGGDEVDDEL